MEVHSNDVNVLQIKAARTRGACSGAAAEQEAALMSAADLTDAMASLDLKGVSSMLEQEERQHPK